MKDETTNLPKDLAGYQQIHHGEFIDGDIVMDTAFAYPSGARMLRPSEISQWNSCHPNSVDAWYLYPLNGTRRVYRKMPCPKQSDGHEREVGYQSITPPYEMIPGEKKKAETYDDGKDPLAYLPWDGVRAVSRVQAYGHRKYKDYNNFRKGMEVGRNLSCALRHIASYMEGESLDPESKESHLAHAACRLLFVLQNEHDKTAIDDRFKK